MNVNIINTLKNVTENIINKENTIAKKEKNIIKYKTSEYNCILKINSPKEIVFNRKNNDMDCTMYFKLNKKTTSIYTIKKEYQLEFDIKTTFLKITDKLIEIHYIIIDAQTNYEYIIEMSEIK